MIIKISFNENMESKPSQKDFENSNLGFQHEGFIVYILHFSVYSLQDIDTFQYLKSISIYKDQVNNAWLWST